MDRERILATMRRLESNMASDTTITPLNDIFPCTRVSQTSNSCRLIVYICQSKHKIILFWCFRVPQTLAYFGVLQYDEELLAKLWKSTFSTP